MDADQPIEGSDEDKRAAGPDEEFVMSSKKKGRKAKSKEPEVPVEGDKDEGADGVDGEASVAAKAEQEDGFENEALDDATAD